MKTERKEKFTPGPWGVDVGGFSSSPSYEPAFSVVGPPSDFMYLERLEDAHLIAAAPDLYAALEKALPVLVQHLEEPWRGVMPFEPEASKMRADLEQVAAVRAALAKARGGAQ